MESPYIPTCWHFSRIFCSAHFGRLYLPKHLPPQKKETTTTTPAVGTAPLRPKSVSALQRLAILALHNSWTPQTSDSVKDPTGSHLGRINGTTSLSPSTTKPPPLKKGWRVVIQNMALGGSFTLQIPMDCCQRHVQKRQTLPQTKYLPGEREHISHQNGFQPENHWLKSTLKRGYVIVPKRLLWFGCTEFGGQNAGQLPKTKHPVTKNRSCVPSKFFWPHQTTTSSFKL